MAEGAAGFLCVLHGYLNRAFNFGELSLGSQLFEVGRHFFRNTEGQRVDPVSYWRDRLQLAIHRSISCHSF